jgi:hypothetical protein
VIKGLAKLFGAYIYIVDALVWLVEINSVRTALSLPDTNRQNRSVRLIKVIGIFIPKYTSKQ